MLGSLCCGLDSFCPFICVLSRNSDSLPVGIRCMSFIVTGSGVLWAPLQGSATGWVF